MKILVTGSTGFIGSYFIPMLLHQGHTVKLLVRNEEKARKLLEILVITILEILQIEVV